MQNNQIINSSSWIVIYIYTFDSIPEFKDYCKIGETSIPAHNLKQEEITHEMVWDAAKKRISQQTNTAGLSPALKYATLAIRKNQNGYSIFHDHTFHGVLKNNNIIQETPVFNDKIKKGEIIKSNGIEWFKCNYKDAINYLEQVKEGKINLSSTRQKITLRDEQEEASKKISNAYEKFKNDTPSNDNKKKNNFLLDCIMRFGKCITTYDFINKNDIKKTLILTHKPVVEDSWIEDFRDYFQNENDQDTKQKNYYFLNKKELNNCDEKNIIEKHERLIYFASVQDMRDIKYLTDKDNKYILDENGNKQIEKDEFNNIKFKESNNVIFSLPWDLIIIDEAHEGNLTTLAELMYLNLKRKFTLFLSGTTFNLRYDDEFETKFGNNIYKYDQKQETERKENWEKEHGTDYNPYAELPDISLNGIKISKENLNDGKNITGYENNYFDFSLFFELDGDNKKFSNEQKIIEWLDNISSDDENDIFLSKMPYNKKNRFYTQHSLWMLPSTKVCKRLKELLEQHPYFKKHGYKIFNVSGNEYDNNSLGEIKKTTNLEDKCSITLSVDRLTTGVTIKGWSTILLLCNTKSPMKYFQTIYRAKSPSPKEWKQQKTCALIFDFNPDRLLELVYSVIKSQKNNNYDKIDDETIRIVLNYYNVMCFIDTDFVKVDSANLKAIIHNAISNEVVSNGFKSSGLLDYKKLEKEFNNDPNKTSEFLNKLHSKSGKSNNNSKQKKITDHGLDVAIVSGDDTNSNIKEKDVDNAATEWKIQREKIKQTINKIFTRVPFMLIGKAKEISENYKNIKELTPEKFTRLYDFNDWSEIMQSLEKTEFIDAIKKLINEDIFYESCQKWISRILEINKSYVNPLERVDKWVETFSLIHNPDSETVLTPWEVVKLHYEKANIDWNDAYKNGKTFLDINSKSSFYCLYAAMKLYEQSLIKNKIEWEKIVKKHIFLICKTKLSKQVAMQLLSLGEKDRNIQTLDIYDEIKNEI